MPFSRPLLTDLINRTRDDVISRLPSPDVLRRSDAEVYTRALSGVAHGIYGYIDWLAKQLIYDTAETDMLERWASIWGISRKPATQAIGTVTFTGAEGAPIPSGSVLSAYDGVLYQTTASGAIAAGLAAIPVVSQNSGIAGNRATGQTFSSQSTLPGVAAVIAAGGMTGGADVENDDSLRARLLFRIKQPPQGGDSNDYLAWALAVPGVTRAWVYPKELGVGTVTVRFMMDGTYLNGIPQAGDVNAVYNYIDPLRPVTAAVTVVAPIAQPLNFTISGLTPPGVEVKNAIIAELTDLIYREAIPGGTLLISHIQESISTAAGEYDHVLVSPAGNVVNSAGIISTMGTVTWV